ncbi:MAG: hypothetical protein JNL83_38840 [Myxococcales bacterium]|nr:hypothetical protein [Myxococcales bacterium]
MAEAWMKCTECRTEIAYGSVYWQCSVSTCNRSRMPLYFCSVVCWDSHLASARHRDAWAEEVRAPTKEAWAKEQAAAPPPSPPPAPTPTQPSAAPVRRVVGDASPVTAAAAEGVKLTEVVDKDILIVVSKMKKYIKDRSGFNCSDAVAEYLSDHVRAVCDEAIRAAARDERRTVLDRDVPRARR